MDCATGRSGADLLLATFSQGDPSSEVVPVVKAHKGKKIQAIIQADMADLFEICSVSEQPPEQARVYPSIRCARCGEKVMESRVTIVDDRPLYIPCIEKEKGSGFVSTIDD